MSTGWEFFLGRSSDMAILSRITDATDKSLSPVFNQKGSFSCTIKIDSAAALLVEKWKHCIMVQRPNGTIAWSGPITAIVDSANTGTTTLTAQGWQSELDYRWIRTVTELQEAVAYATPIPSTSNPSFETNNSGWTASGSAITRDTGTKDSGSASGRWENTSGGNDNLTAGDTLSTTFSGTFFVGVTYVLTIKMKASATLLAGNMYLDFGDISSSDYTRKNDPSIDNSSFQSVIVTWIPSSTFSAATLKFTASGGGWRFWIDSIALVDSIHTDAPVFINPTFKTNTTGWTATTSAITRDTVYVDSGSASGRWENTSGMSDNLGSGDVLETTASGTFFKGTSYTATIRIKSSSSTGNTFPLLLSWGSGGNNTTMWIGFDDTRYKTVSITWTPSSTTTTATFGMLVSVTSPFFFVNIDSCKIERNIAIGTVFTDVDDGKIAEALVRLANRQTDSDGVTRATHLTPNGTSTQKRTRTYQVGQNIGAAIKELSDIENGFDIEVDPETRDIDFIPNTSFTDQTDIVYGYKTFPNNLEDVVVNDDGSGKANSINVQGAYVIGNADSLADIADIGIILEDWLSAADIKNENIVGAYANEELVFRVDGQMTIAAKPALGAPMPYIDYDWGDKVYISTNRGRMQLDRQAARVFSGRISWNSQNEAVLDELGLAP